MVLEAIGALLWPHLVLDRVRLLLGLVLTRSALVQIGLTTTVCTLQQLKFNEFVQVELERQAASYGRRCKQTAI